jgi:hypothetical protein
MSKTYSNFIHFASLNATFCYLPKVACTNWKCIARRVQGEENWLDTALAHNRNRNGLIFLDPSDAEDLIKINGCNMNLCMVRSPYLRILSAYLNKIERNFGAPKKVDFWTSVTAKIYEGIDLSKPAVMTDKEGFSLFLEWILDSGDFERFDEHWAPQSSIMKPDLVRFSHIERFEDLPSSATKLMSLLGCDFDFPTQDKINFQSMGTNAKLARYYSERSIELINYIYGEDFTNFDYAVFDTLDQLITGPFINDDKRIIKCDF